ncbi:conserved hypothetical protein, partial [Ricinus communis]
LLASCPGTAEPDFPRTREPHCSCTTSGTRVRGKRGQKDSPPSRGVISGSAGNDDNCVVFLIGESGCRGIRRRRKRLFERSAAPGRQHLPIGLALQVRLEGVRGKRPPFHHGVVDALELGIGNALGDEFRVRRLALERRVTQRPVQGVIAHYRIRPQPGVMAIAGPWIVTGLDGELAAHRIELDEAAAGEEILVGLDQRGAEPPLEQAAAALVFLVEPRHVQTAELLHHQGQAGVVGRGRQQVQVSGHQRVGMDRHAVKAGRLLQPTEQARVILLVAEDQLVIVAAMKDVVRLMGKDETGLAGHDGAIVHPRRSPCP